MSLLFHQIIDHTVFIYMDKIVFLSLSKKTTSFVSDAIKKDSFSDGVKQYIKKVSQVISLEMNSKSGTKTFVISCNINL